ncbi:MAG: non-canonical purine NTP diphosphatase [Prevotellaceae bacterium]|nr:non-canonical purine NTP diphosphatase [Prevotellaceae bacterium]
MQKTLVFATNNAHKFQEVTDMLQGSIVLLRLKDIGCEADIPETAGTLEGNALQKARFIYDNYHVDCFADDTGLEVEALHGAPGVYSARYAGEAHDAEANMQKLLLNLQHETNRKARFRCVFTLIEHGEVHQFEGIVNGTITQEKHGKEGFGYDPLFIPDGYKETFAEMDETRKNQISHRARALQKLVAYLKEESK